MLPLTLLFIVVLTVFVVFALEGVNVLEARELVCGCFRMVLSTFWGIEFLFFYLLVYNSVNFSFFYA